MLRGLAKIAPALLAAGLLGCHGGGGSDHHSSTQTNIDLAIKDFAVSPTAADPEDSLTLTGNIVNLGTEAANPMLGDSFKLLFNLSTNGTIQLKELGFFDIGITDPIPPGGIRPFSFNAPYGGGDTLAINHNFCTIFPNCVPPQPGILGVKVDADEMIRELDETNNFQFIPFQVVGTRVSAKLFGCDVGGLDPNGPGCNLLISDGKTIVRQHAPCSTCPDDLVYPNELQPFVDISVSIKGCSLNSCGGSWDITMSTVKPGLPPSIITLHAACSTVNQPDHACTWPQELIRDPNY
jgi:hypothetical protein